MRRPWLQLFAALAAVAGCKSAPSGPAKSPPPLVPKHARALEEIARDLAAVHRAEPDLPRWTLVDTADIAGVFVERYAMPDGTRLLFAPDPSSRAISYQTWFSAGAGGAPPDPAAVRRAVERLRSRPGTASMRRLESHGAMVAAGVFGELGYFRTTMPSRSIGRSKGADRDDALESLIEIESERWAAIGAPAPPGAVGGPSTAAKKGAGGKRAGARRPEESAPASPSAEARTPREVLERAFRARIASAEGGGPAAKGAVVAVAGDVDRKELLARMRRAYRGGAEAALGSGRKDSTSARNMSPPPSSEEVGREPRASAPARKPSEQQTVPSAPVSARIDVVLDPPAESQKILLGWPLSPSVEAVPMAGSEKLAEGSGPKGPRPLSPAVEAVPMAGSETRAEGSGPKGPRPLSSQGTDDDRLHLEAIAYLLAEGTESRLGRALLPSVAHAVEAQVPSRSGAGALEVFISLRTGQSSTTAMALVDREIQAIARGETTGLEVEVLKSTLRAEALTALDDLEERAAAIARAELTAGDPGAITRRLAAIAALGEREIRAAAVKYLVYGTRVEVVGRPPSPKSPERKAPPKARGKKAS